VASQELFHGRHGIVPAELAQLLVLDHARELVLKDVTARVFLYVWFNLWALKDLNYSFR